MAGGTVREVGSKAELDAAVGGARAAAVHFWAAWCEASKQMDEVFAHLAVDFPHALFLRGLRGGLGFNFVASVSEFPR